MDYRPDVLGADPFAAAEALSGAACRVCGCGVGAADGFCRTCGTPDPAKRGARVASGTTGQPATSTEAPGDPADYRVPGGMLVLAAVLVGVGCAMPWISPTVLFGLTPPMVEVWPIVAGAGVLGILGLVALAYGRNISRFSWLLALVGAVGIAALAYPHYSEVAQEIVAAGPGSGVSHGIGLWLVAGGIVTALIASAAGWRAATTSGRG